MFVNLCLMSAKYTTPNYVQFFVYYLAIGYSYPEPVNATTEWLV